MCKMGGLVEVTATRSTNVGKAAAISALSKADPVNRGISMDTWPVGERTYTAGFLHLI